MCVCVCVYVCTCVLAFEVGLIIFTFLVSVTKLALEGLALPHAWSAGDVSLPWAISSE